MDTKKEISRIALLGIISGLCAASSTLSASELVGTDLAKCGGGCSGKTGKPKYTTSSYDSSNSSNQNNNTGTSTSNPNSNKMDNQDEDK